MNLLAEKTHADMCTHACSHTGTHTHTNTHALAHTHTRTQSSSSCWWRLSFWLSHNVVTAAKKPQEKKFNKDELALKTAGRSVLSNNLDSNLHGGGGTSGRAMELGSQWHQFTSRAIFLILDSSKIQVPKSHDRNEKNKQGDRTHQGHFKLNFISRIVLGCGQSHPSEDWKAVGLNAAGFRDFFLIIFPAICL